VLAFGAPHFLNETWRVGRWTLVMIGTVSEPVVLLRELLAAALVRSRDLSNLRIEDMLAAEWESGYCKGLATALAALTGQDASVVLLDVLEQGR